MRYHHNNRTLILSFALAVIWSYLGISKIVDTEGKSWDDYLFLIIGILYIGIFLVQYFGKYFEMTDEKITLTGPFSKTIYFKDLIDMKYYAGDFTFKSKEKTIKISKDQMNKSDVTQFEKQFEKIKDTYNLI